SGQEMILIIVACALATDAASAVDEPLSPAPPVQETEKSWPLGRGNALAQGVAKTTLPAKPDVVWKKQIDNGAFDATSAIADGVVYLGDMDGNVYAWKLAD